VTWIAIAVAAILWLFALLRFIQMSRWMREMDGLIQTADFHDAVETGQLSVDDRSDESRSQAMDAGEPAN
jgi:hypothetical protein